MPFFPIPIRLGRIVGPLLCGILFASLASAEASPRLIIRNPAKTTIQTMPIVARVNNLQTAVYEIEFDRAPSVFAQVFEQDGQRYLATVLRDLPQGELVGRLAQVRQGHEPKGPFLKLESEHTDVKISINGNIFTHYRTLEGPKPFFFPLIGPSGLGHTRAYPMKDISGEDKDHPHQRSFWFTHGKVNGIDFWSETPGHGFIEPIATTGVVSGLGYGAFTSTNRWLGPDRKTPICEDKRQVRIFATEGLRIIDVDITIFAKTGAVIFGDTKEGSLGIRVASSMDAARKGGGTITNAEGLLNEATWGKASPWVDYSGPVEGRTVGIAIMNRPDSFRYPTTWHVRPYGLFAANPFGWHDFGQVNSGTYTLAKGKSLELRYRVVLHSGLMSKPDLQNAFEAYARPASLEAEP